MAVITTAATVAKLTSAFSDVERALAAVGSSPSELRSRRLFGGLDQAIYALWTLSDILRTTDGT
ncbi:hypothetical protein CERSUDRAFT_92796 [Gelatoporia subvermispora B]|uniref:Uncharacterized protein n=1 Tax=Ceriporiopsis subvermispora (strain B) TaxID=914234 RepID=M2PQD4_CERS8|nr:hypothetical protein CERSUDRAFT_92796 [Gelatoporia subvermispora B]